MTSVRRAGEAPGQHPVRNVVLVGHSGAGKTQLVEAALAHTGAIPRAGRVEDGTTVGDHEDVERRLGRSVSLAVASTLVEDPDLTGPDGPVRVTFVDTPGHADLVGELRAGLRAADAALFVVSAVDGIDGGTRMIWEECAAVGMPRAVVVTHVDQPRGDFEAIVDICRRLFGEEGVHPLFMPLLADDEQPAGLLGLLSGTVHDLSGGQRASRPADPEHLEVVAGRRDALIEAVITESDDDTLLERYLAGEQVGFGTLAADLATAVARGTFHPVLPCVPTTGLGVHELLQVVCRCFPTPREHVLPPVFTPSGAAREPLSGRADGPLVAEVVKTSTDPYVGRLSVVRVFSGTLLPDTPVHVSGHFARFTGDPRDETWHGEHDVDERVGAVSRPLGASSTQLPRAVAGDVVTVARLSRAETGDTLSDPADPAVMEPWTMPHPLLPVAIAAASARDEDRLLQGLARLQAEDPTIRVEVDPDTHQMVLWVMGELQLEVLLDRLRSRHGVEVRTAPVQVAVRETVRGTGRGVGRHVKQSGGHGQYAVAEVTVEPLPEGTGVEFVDAVVGGAVPRQFIGSVEKGVRAQLAKGVTGYPMVDVRVTLTGGRAHSVDSSDAAFQTAGALALRAAADDAGVQLLEPVDAVTVLLDDEFVGAVLGDLATRRARVRGSEPRGSGRTEVQAEVPAFELARYATDLRALAHGTGTFEREPLRHSPAPVHVAQRLARQADSPP